MIIRVNLVQALASCGGFNFWPLSQTCAVVAVLTVNVGSKQRFFLLLVAKDRENPAVGAKNAGRWSR